MKLFTLFFSVFFIAAPELSSIRENYVNAATSQEHAATFFNMFNNISDNHNDNTVLAYKAASIVLKARYEKGLFAKTRLFNNGTDLLDDIIMREPGNYEARLIRLNIQEHVPWITGYTSDVDKDKAFLIKHYAIQEQSLKRFAKKYIIQSGVFTENEKTNFN